MKTNSSITLNNIMQHKQYFDQRLVEICDELKNEVTTLLSKCHELESRVQQLKKLNNYKELKINDLKSMLYTAKKQCKEIKDERDEIMEYLRKIQEEIDKLGIENEQQKKEIERQEKDIEDQKKIINKLRFQNSTNSNMPSSTDILSHSKPKKPKKESEGKSRGGQKNHPLHKSIISKKPDRIITKKVKKAPTGAVPICDDKGNIRYYATQEVDLVLKSSITETRYYIEDEGKNLDKETMKKYAINPLIYSGDFKASVVYLNQQGTIPLQRLCDIMCDISKGSVQLRPGTISKWCQECHIKSKEKKEEILVEILKEDLTHADETGIKINGVQYWIQVITNNKGVYYCVLRRRGDKNQGIYSLLETYGGTVVHDHFAMYLSLKQCSHAECNAHIDRYMKNGEEFDNSDYCKKVRKLMHEMLDRKYKLIEEGKSSMAIDDIEEFRKEFINLLEEGIKDYEEKNPDIEKRYEAVYVKTFRRMLEYMEDHLKFITDFKVPYTNNKAELQCRAVKAKKNSSKQFVSEIGGESYASILSLLQTSKIKNKNALETLKSVFN